ncbi:unnamed protein product [Fusarium graminearum]|nr:unnamed protein product [Fusarium graminearum]
MTKMGEGETSKSEGQSQSESSVRGEAFWVVGGIKCGGEESQGCGPRDIATQSALTGLSAARVNAPSDETL